MKLHDPTPILCRTCGAPIEPTEDVALRCEHCGATDELPREAQARVRELRRRLVARARQVGQISDFTLALASVFEQPRLALRRLLPVTPTLLFLLLHPLAIFVLPGLPIALVSAFIIGRRFYRRDLRGLLRAGPARTVAGPARCRCCGVELPRCQDPLIRCHHCGTRSLVGPAFHLAQSVDLAREVRADGHHHADLLAASKRLGHMMDRVFLHALVLGFLGWLALVRVVSALVDALS